MCLNFSKLVQRGSSGSSGFKCVQICSKPVQMCSNVLKQHKNMDGLLYRFGLRKNYELYFGLSRLGLADSGSLLCQPVSGKMRPKPFENIKYTQCLFSTAKLEENPTNINTGLELPISICC